MKQLTILQIVRKVSIAKFLSLASLLMVTNWAVADSGTSTILSYTDGTTVLAGTNSPGCPYTRMVRLQYSGSANGRLLATFENANRNFPMYQSDDDGVTWTGPIGTCSETHVSGWYFQWQPHLFELPTALNNLPAGTLLLAGISIGSPPGQHMEIYCSTNQGQAWFYRGTPDTSPGTNGGIWEPNLQIATNGQLVCYYSDETKSGQGYNQLIAERTSGDGGLTWGAEQYVVAIADGVQRPGMPVTAKLPNGQYVMSFEAVNSSNGSPAHIKFSSDGLIWGSGASDYGTGIQTSSGAYVGATPYICWSPLGGVNGALIVCGENLINSQNTDRELLINTNLGQGNWTMLPSPVQWQGGGVHAGWSQCIIPTVDGKGIIHMADSCNSGAQDFNSAVVAREALVLPGYTYYVLNQKSGLALDIPGGSSTMGVVLDIWNWLTNTAQSWTFNDLGSNTWTVTNPGDSLAWDDSGWATTNGSVVDQWGLNALAVQQWQMRPVGNGYLKFRNVNSTRYLAVTDGSTNAGSSVMQWDDVGAPDENWMPTQSLLPNGSYKIIATTTGNVLDCSGNSNTDGTGIDLWTYWDGPNQKWYIQSLGNGYYSIRNLSDGVIGRSLDCTGASPNDGTVIQLWDWNGGPWQEWAITPTSNGAYVISTAQAKSNGVYDVLDGQSCSGANGTQVQLWTWDGGGCQQQWYIQAAY